VSVYAEHGPAGLAVAGDGSDSSLTPRQEAEVVEWARAKAPTPRAARAEGCVSNYMNRANAHSIASRRERAPLSLL
jgi:hypothetical protein